MEALNAVARRLHPRRTGKALAGASDEDLICARDELTMFFQTMSVVSSLALVVTGRPFPGLALLPAFDVQRPSREASVLLLGWLSLRGDSRFRSGLPMIAHLGQQLEAGLSTS